MTFNILLYHGVTKNKSKGIENFSGKHIDYKKFTNQMKWLKRYANLISMDEMVYHYDNNLRLPKNTTLITFDDGFKNNYSVACPILNDMNIPATFYVTSGMIGKSQAFWVDRIENSINLSAQKFIDLRLDKNEHFDLRTKKQRIIVIKKIKKYCKNTKNTKKEELIKKLEKITGVKTDNNSCKNYQIMNWKELKKLSENDNFIVGGHSMHHEILSSLSIQKMRENIKKSIKILKEKLQKEILHYSYPEVQINHYNNNVINELKKNGIKCCPSAIDGQANFSQGLFNLRRVMVGLGGVKFPYNKIKK